MAIRLIPFLASLVVIGAVALAAIDRIQALAFISAGATRLEARSAPNRALGLRVDRCHARRWLGSRPRSASNLPFRAPSRKWLCHRPIGGRVHYAQRTVRDGTSGIVGAENLPALRSIRLDLGMENDVLGGSDCRHGCGCGRWNGWPIADTRVRW